ncbi:alpha/beta fold hydrolase [Embleya sp. NPDC008237]|uniref:alpha/beta fold hydrolase n=1 Tax=Embleya sp. NPDC008237 TaxID=3363978 RepID=UPI0036E563BC
MDRIVFGAGSGSALARRGAVPGSPTVLFVHPANLQARCWRAVLAAVPDAWTCLAIDLSGHGSSARRDAYDLAGWVRECVELLDAREVAGVHVVGASVGAAVAVELAAAHPDRVESVTTVGGAFRPADPAASREFLAAVAARGARNAVLDILASEPGLDEVLVAEVAADIGVESDTQAARIWTAAAAAAGLDAAPRLRCPTLAIVGDRDLGCPVEDSRAFAELTGGRLAVLVEHGHLPMYTAPTRVAAHLASLVDGTREHHGRDRNPAAGGSPDSGSLGTGNFGTESLSTETGSRS